MSAMALSRRRRARADERAALVAGAAAPRPAVGCMPIGDVRWRQRVRIAGRVRSMRVRPWADVPTLECVLVDDTGGVTVVFLGRRLVPGIRPGACMLVDGMAGAHHGRLAMLNPDYTLLDGRSALA